MAESVLPAGLEMLKIDLKRELDDFDTSNDSINPFSIVGSGARKKIRKAVVAEEPHSCPLGIFGSGFAKSSCRPTAAARPTCRCNVYIPSKFRNHGKRSGQDGDLLQVKSTSTFKRNIVQKSKLNFLKMHDVTKQSCRQIDPLTQSRSAKLLQRPSCMQSSEAISEVNSSKHSSQNQVPGMAVPDFKSLIPSSQKQISSFTCNPVFDSLSFKSLQNSKTHSRQYQVEHLNEKSEEDDLVNSVSKKLSVTGVAPSNSNASCSQEARLTANAYCDEHDISIDELASYFEDFVHIPKKMSLMAEQMYI